jgi:hypothetical protein
MNGIIIKKEDGVDLQMYTDNLDNLIKEERRQKFLSSDQLSLGALIAKLETIVENQKTYGDNKDDPRVYYDFGDDRFPTRFDSWRGIYRELALDCDSEKCSEDLPIPVSDFLELCRETIGKSFEGYKGGEYIMDEETPIWIANYGDCGNTALIDIMDVGWRVILITGCCEAYPSS